ncbi:response regulator [Polyangium jinanense]|uniref:Response regulator n=1 Tax=Polyangium jinanense TaxID=2829994 RepID=A0A9X3XFY3_9BACT|nr:response regulator [Polyangium jinanense]MDC3958942.1 response regulator [Polyangium jinanense]MDC3989567.1 response regulator [Polyangium jinanense]
MTGALDGLVLVVDDNHVDLDVLTMVLQNEGTEIAVATDGRSAWQMLGEERPDLVFLDVNLPDVNGFELCQRMQANPETKDVPVIFMTALSDRESKLKGLRMGAVDYIGKPFDVEELLARFRLHLSLCKTTKALREKNAELDDARTRLEAELAERRSAEEERTRLHQQIMEAQRARLLELSTPLVPISEGILVMPIVGVMDEDRTTQMLDAALQGAAEAKATFVIVDLTGLRSFDARVAPILPRLRDGLALLGTQIVLTGISAEAARAIIHQGIDLNRIPTRATLKEGIRLATRERNASVR